MKKIFAAIIIILCFTTAFLLKGCRTTFFNFDTRNMSFLYNPSVTLLHPECFVYHSSDTLSLLFFKINTNELFFNTQSKDFFNKARIQVHYRLLDAAKNDELLDSATVSYFIQRGAKQGKFITYIPIHTSHLQKYTLEVIYIDFFRHRGSQSILSFDKSTLNSPQNFFLSSEQLKEPWFQNTFHEDDLIKIRYDRQPISKIFVKYYNITSPLPLPPFSTKKMVSEKLIPDSIWTIPYNDSTIFRLVQKGMYFIQTDTTKSDGLTLLNFGKFYPEIKEAEELIKPIRFLTTKKKFEELNTYENSKIALDDFWLKLTGTVAHSKELLRIYYSRIQLANKFFVSYTEGWKTDRGMIYTVFGSPGTIFKSDNMEKWIYGERTNQPSMNFTFEKVDNTFSENDYVLIRNDIYKTSWFQAVDVWRNGKAYSVEN